MNQKRSWWPNRRTYGPIKPKFRTVCALKQAQIQLPIDDLPSKWYNIVPDLHVKLPSPKDPEEGESRLQALGRRMLSECLKQEASDSRWVDIPDGVRELYFQAKSAETRGEEKCILINISGHGFLDISAYREILRMSN